MGTHRNRHSKGTRQGGRFATTTRSESGMSLNGGQATATLEDVHYLRENAGTPGMETEEFRQSLNRVLDYAEGQLDDEAIDFDTAEDRKEYYEALDMDIEYSMIEKQRTLLVDTAQEISDQCPDVGTIDLEFDHQGEISVKEARRRDGTPAAQADKDTIGALLKWGNPNAYDRIMGEPIDIDSAIAWRPAGSASPVAV